ncbi:Uncharacterized protein Fot_30465 [Forsythia ovata]|uniref:Uncharacterized protein n=1 Tax=Forsythia ovata TaxID=205694 RepID=A0ABD1TUT7_9LAMI
MRVYSKNFTELAALVVQFIELPSHVIYIVMAIKRIDLIRIRSVIIVGDSNSLHDPSFFKVDQNVGKGGTMERGESSNENKVMRVAVVRTEASQPETIPCTISIHTIRLKERSTVYIVENVIEIQFDTKFLVDITYASGALNSSWHKRLIRKVRGH